MSQGRKILDPKMLSPPVQKVKEFLESRIVGQDHTIQKVIRSIELANSKLRPPNKPIFISLFAGPTATGKTKLAESVAECLLGSPNAMTKIECQTMSERHETSKLIGAAPGYIGYEENMAPLAQANIDRHAVLYNYNQLLTSDNVAMRMHHNLQNLYSELERFKNRKEYKGKIDEYETALAELKKYIANKSQTEINYSIILFDEIERAHRSIHSLLLEINDKARLTLSNGRVTNFSNSFIFMTSNVGAFEMGKRFEIGLKSKGSRKESVNETVNKAVRKVFTPEFLGRIQNGVIIFNPLSLENLKEIIRRKINDLIYEVKAQYEITLLIEDTVRNFILKEVENNPEYGARGIENIIQEHLRMSFASLLNTGQIKVRDSVQVLLEDNNLIFQEN